MIQASDDRTFTLDDGESVQRHFARERYLILPGLITDPLLAVANEYVIKRCRFDASLGADKDVQHAHCCYGDPLTETLMELVQPVVESCTGLELYPTYSYFRQYHRGAALRSHVDRPACEITASVMLGYTAEEPWPIWLDLPGGALEVPLERGDAVVFRGCEDAHWREPFNGEYANQVFLHFVVKDGPNAGWRYDGRRDVGAPKSMSGSEAAEQG